ncbi:MAG: DUF2624 family protein [Bacilli bacterium]|nr:DUF2624 family protein [Bacilli bacterium]
MKFVIRKYIETLTEKEIEEFAIKEGIKLLDEEKKVIYLYIKNYWETLLEEDSTFIFEELKEKLQPKTYEKVIELYNKYKKKN